jgi:hypothetical protein
MERLSKIKRACSRPCSKHSRDADFKEQLLPDIDAYLSDYLGKWFPKDEETKLNKAQSTVVAIASPVVFAWQ